MALGATGSVDDAISISRATGEMLDAMGVNMNYAPSCDVNSEPSNPVIGVRSPGDSGALVGRISSGLAQGLREKNIVPCVKHFPGHGDTKVDSHYGVPIVHKGREELEACELVPFRRAAAEKIEAVMTSHIVLPTLDDSNLPMSINKRCVDLLRNELQYDGLSVTDCLEMDAIRVPYGTEKGAMMAIAGGVDCAMVCHTFNVQIGAYEEVFKAVKAGTITMDRVSKSATRVDNLKNKFLTWESALRERSVADLTQLNVMHNKLAAEVYARSATLVKDTQGCLPLSSLDSLVYVCPFEKPTQTGAAASGEIYFQGPCIPEQFVEIVKRYSPGLIECRIYEGSDPDDATKHKISNADVVILATRNARMSPHQQHLSQMVATLAKKLVTVATCDPYDFLEAPEIKTNISIYEPNPEAFLPAAQIIFGAAKPLGTLPVLTSRPKFPIVPFDPNNDMNQVIQLWHKVLPQYAVPAKTLTDLLTRSNANNFILRSQNEAIGFVATYANDDRASTFISALLVDPAHQSQGVGTALIEHARQYLRNTSKTRSVTIGSSFPRFWPGVPLDIPKPAQEFFVHRGFRPEPGATARDYTIDLRTYEPPAAVLGRAANSRITFAPWRKDQYEECLRNQKEHFGNDPVWVGAYERLAQADQYPQAMVAFDESGRQVGWTLMQELGIGMTNELALQPVVGEKSGQIGCVGVDPAARNKGVGLALIAHAALDMKRRGMHHVFIDWVNHVNWYERAGFKVWREYRPMTLKELA